MTELRIAAGEQRTILTSAVEPDVTYQIGAGADVTIISIIDSESAGVRLAYLAAEANLRWFTFILGGKVSLEVGTYHDGRAASSQHNALFFGSDHDRFIMNFWSEHNAEQTSGHILTHGVLFDQAYSHFKGNVHILAGGRQTSATLTEHALLLGERARSSAVPQLQIEHNEVQVSHSVSTSRIDEEQLFYLTSRGLTAIEARRLIVRGFLNTIIEQTPDASIQGSLREMIEEKLIQATP